jgi:hypothetical protein
MTERNGYQRIRGRSVRGIVDGHYTDSSFVGAQGSGEASAQRYMPSTMKARQSAQRSRCGKAA